MFWGSRFFVSLSVQGFGVFGALSIVDLGRLELFLGFDVLTLNPTKIKTQNPKPCCGAWGFGFGVWGFRMLGIGAAALLASYTRPCRYRV